MSRSRSSNCLKFSLPVFFLLFWLTGRAQNRDFSEADRLLETNKKALGNELTALVYNDSMQLYRKDLGEYFNGKIQAPIGDCSQWLTAAMVMTFVDQGKIGLDEPLGKYLPVLEKYMKGYITLRQCLTHTTGIENDQTHLGRMLSKKKFQTLEDNVNYLASREIHNNPGKEFSYGEIGMNIAARVCEIIGKKPYERLMQERITRPLRMRGTSFFNERGDAPDPSNGGTSTANDYMNFLLMMLNKGKFMGKQILSEKAVAEMEKIQFASLPVVYAPPFAGQWHYGIGAWIAEADAAGQGQVIICPSLAGTWAILDRCHGYAAILFVKSQLNDPRADIMKAFKEAIDARMGACH